MANSLHTVIIDDQDSRISYSGQWLRAGGSGDFSRTLVAPKSEGAQMTFQFTGTSVTAVGTFETGGSCKGAFTIDGTPSPYGSPSINSSQPQQTIWTSPELPEGQHTLVYTSSSCSSNTPVLWFDYLLYHTVNASDAATIFIDDRDQRLQYSGNWVQGGDDGDFGRTRQGGSKDSTVQLSFTGSSITVVGTLLNPTAAIQTTFVIDGQNQGTYGSGSQTKPIFNVELFRNGSLGQGDHTLVMTCVADGPFWLDYILLRSTPSRSKPKFPIAPVIGAIAGALVVAGFLAWFFLYFKKRKSANGSSTKRTTRRITRYDNTPDPFSRNPLSGPSHPRPAYITSVYSSTQSAAGLLAATSPYDAQSLTSTRPPASIHTAVLSHSHQDDFDNPPDHLPPEYATTAPSGSNIGHIVSPPSITSGYSNASSARYPPSPSRSGYTNIHHRHSSLPPDVPESETGSVFYASTSHSTAPRRTTRSSTQLRPSPSISKRNPRLVAINADEEERSFVSSSSNAVTGSSTLDDGQSIAELKRKQHALLFGTDDQSPGADSSISHRPLSSRALPQPPSRTTSLASSVPNVQAESSPRRAQPDVPTDDYLPVYSLH